MSFSSLCNNCGKFIEYHSPDELKKLQKEGIPHEELKGKGVDLFDYKRPDASTRERWHELITENALIVGGGGLLNRPGFAPHMKMLTELSKTRKKIVFWGVGHNEKKSKYYGKPIGYNIDTSKFDLVGVRDYGRNEDWVPCVSCMHSIFDKNFSNLRDVGVVFHQKTLKHPKTIERFKDFDSIANNSEFEDMVNFIGSSNTIVTNSYHAMYWSMLLDKKVVVIPNSSKFYDFKHQPVFSDLENFKEDLEKAHSYSGILEECREINGNFSEKVFNYLNI